MEKMEENQDEYLKEIFDISVFDGDYGDIYQYSYIKKSSYKHIL